MEWLALLLLVPAIVVPVVLLLGFAGCEALFPLEFDEPFEQTFAADPTSMDSFQDKDVCLIQRIESVRLSDSGSQVQLTLRALDQEVVVQRILISQPAGAGDPYDSADDLTDVASAVVVIPNSSITLPPVAYNLDRTKPLLIAMDIPASSGAIPFLQPVSPTEATAFFKKDIFEASIPDRQSNYDDKNRIYLIERIDVAP